MSGYRPKSDERAIEIYVTKYALTKGVIKASGTTRDGKYVNIGSTSGRWLVGPSDWVATEEEAVSEFERLRNKKIASLKRQLTKVEAMIEPKFVDHVGVGRDL